MWGACKLIIFTEYTPLTLQLREPLPHIVHRHLKELVWQLLVITLPLCCRVQVEDKRLPVHRLQH